MSDKNKDTFLFNIMTDPRFRMVTGRSPLMEIDIRRGEHVMILPDDLHVYIPRELNEDPDAMDRYAVGAVRYMQKHGKFCECGRLNRMDAGFDQLAREYRRQWHIETHGKPPETLVTWPKRHAMEGIGARIIEAARSNNGSLDEAVATYNALDAEPDDIDCARICEVTGEQP